MKGVRARVLRPSLPSLLWTLVMILVGLLMLFPVYWIFYLAISSPGTEFSFPPGLVPGSVKINNLWDTFGGGTSSPGNMGHYFLNSAIYAIAATAGCLITQSIVAYGFARLRFPGRNALFGITLAMLMMPFVVTLVPRFLLFSHLHLTNSLWPLIIPWWFGGSPYGVFLMRQYFMSIPFEMDEAARIDGAGHWQVLWRILIPQSLPALVALAILEGSYFWNDLMGPLIYLQSDGVKTLPLGIIFHYAGQYNPQYALLFAAALLMILPILLIFLVLQRQFQQGFLASGLSGR